jgi:hypothetical protein
MKWRQRHHGDSIRHIVGGRRQAEFVACLSLFVFSPTLQIVIHGQQIQIRVFPTTVHCSRMHIICMNKQYSPKSTAMQKCSILFLVCAYITADCRNYYWQIPACSQQRKFPEPVQVVNK